MADGDIVRKITISATGENIDSTTESVKKLGDETTKASAANDKSKTSYVDLAAGLYIAQTAYNGIASALGSVSAGSDKAGESMGRATSAITSAIGAVLAYLPQKFIEIWQEGIDKLNTYIDLNQKAGDLGVEFYQRLSKAATDAKKPADDYLKIIQNINKALDRTLGTDGLQNGSAFNTLATELQKNGNLSGQTADINRVNNSVTAPEQLQSSLKLIQDALDAGQKLVAFKLANTLLGPEAAENLKKDNDYFYQIQKHISDVAAKDIIKQPDVDRAAAMNAALEKSQKIIDSWFTSTKSDWSSLGIDIQQLWVNANTNFASVLSWLDKILGKAQEIANVKANPENSIWTKIGDYFTNNGKDMPDGMTRLNDADRQKGVAQQQLASQLGNKSNIDRARAESQKADDWLTPDKSKPPPAPDDTTSAWNRTTGSIEKYIQVTNAAAKSVDATAAEHEKLKVIAELTAAGIKDGLTPAAAAAQAQMSGLGDRAAKAAEALAKAKIASEIKWDHATAFLNADDLAIATKLKGIYGDDIPKALNSAEAAAMRMNNTLKAVGGILNTAFDSATPAIRDAINGTTSLSQGFKNLGLVAVKALEDMIIKLMIIKPLQDSIMGGSSGGGLLSFLGIGGTSGAASQAASASTLANNTGGAFFGPGFASGTDYAPGGVAMVGEQGPELVNLPRGASVTPNRQSMAALNGNPVNVAFSPVYNVTGSGPEIAALKAQMAQDRADFESRTIAAVRKAQAGRQLT